MGELKEYRLNFSEDSLIMDVANSLIRELPDLSLEDRLNLAREHVRLVFLLGNHALYHGLIQYCVKQAIKEKEKYQKIP